MSSLDGNGEEKSDLKISTETSLWNFQTWNRAPCWRKSWPVGIPCTVTVDTWSCGRLTFSHVLKTSKQKIRDVENPLNINQQTKPCPSKRRGRAPLKACEIYLPRWKCLGSLHLGQFLPWHSLWVAKMRNAPATYANPTQAERGLARNDFQSQFNKNPSYPKSDPNLCGFSTCLKSQMSVFFRICLPLFLCATLYYTQSLKTLVSVLHQIVASSLAHLARLWYVTLHLLSRSSWFIFHLIRKIGLDTIFPHWTS